jgi:nitrite reductase/ring-hydroxylating ferredoxin subunit
MVPASAELARRRRGTAVIDVAHPSRCPWSDPGVNGVPDVHVVHQVHPAGTVDVGPVAALHGRIPLVVRVEQRSFVIVRTRRGIRAFRDICPHAGSTLHGGRVRRSTLACPSHGKRFDLVTGYCRGEPGLRLAMVPAWVENGRIRIKVPAAT